MKRVPTLNVLALSLAVFLATFHASVCLAETTLQFFYPDEDAKKDKITLTCNESKTVPPAPTKCNFDAQNNLKVALSSWEGKNAVLTNTTNGIVIEDDCRASVSLDKNLPDSYQLEPVCRRNVGGVEFFFPEKDAKGTALSLICNGETFKTSPGNCPPDDQGRILLGLSSWDGATTLFTRTNGIGDTFTGFCNKSWAPDQNQPTAYQLDAACSPGRVDATGDKLVDEWFSDLPWHQKLSTRDSNLIDIPFVLAPAAISQDFCPSSLDATAMARCVLRYGIVNVMAMHRTDTLYLPGEVPKFPFLENCQDGQCVEMKFDIHRFHTQTKDPSGYAADIVTNDSYEIVTNFPKSGDSITFPALGFAITESTVFAPWRAWYTGHFCTVDKDNIADSVCYEDYFTTQLQAPTKLLEQAWLRDRPSLFDPQSEDQFGQYCKKGENHCPMYLGKVAFDSTLDKPEITDCPNQLACPKLDQVENKTKNLDEQFNISLSQFADIGRFPWDGKPVAKPAVAIPNNPFIGFYPLTYTSTDGGSGNYFFRATNYTMPRACSIKDYYEARVLGDTKAIEAIQRLKACSANFEVHTSGFVNQWKELYGGGTLTDANIREINDVMGGLAANQYGRTMFMLAGLPEQKLAVSYFMDTQSGPNNKKLPIHDQIYGSSLYTQFLPQVNEDDQTQKTTQYADNFWHAYFMSNHMNQTPDHFIRGIRGRTLWHNEYRSNMMYSAFRDGLDKGQFKGKLNHIDFPAGFQRNQHKAPFHGNTCDSCHIRNGSGIPLMPNGQLPQIQVDKGMNANYKLWYKPPYPHPEPSQDPGLDYTYTNIDYSDPGNPKQVIPSMKMVLFDVQDNTSGPLEKCDANDHTVPLMDIDSPKDRVYRNKIMNFYGNTFHVNLSDGLPTYTMNYVDIEPTSRFLIVDNTLRRPISGNSKQGQYVPKRPSIPKIQTGNQRCTKPLKPRPNGIELQDWPENCDEVNGDGVLSAIENGEIGFMHLLGKRLGNTPLIEMIPNSTVIATQRAQKRAPKSGGIGTAGCFGLAPGTRVGSGGATNYQSCTSQRLGTRNNDCYLSRFGWIGDRASLEDQVANAAFAEENISSKEGYQQINPNAQRTSQLVRYKEPMCGPADRACQNSETNSDITEQEIRDMATYQRWIGIPERSEYQVSTDKVQNGEKHFRALGCASCHVIDKITFVESDNSLPDEERAELKKLQNSADPNYPFVSYLGTDLLLHDMGYLSQVAKKPVLAADFRKSSGVINPKYRAYIQLIRTPPLKGLRFNRFVTDSNHNSKLPIEAIKSKAAVPAKDIVPGCDFLLHDGRACDAIEAAYLHDGPAVKALGMIKRLNDLTDEELTELRAFLYSL